MIKKIIGFFIVLFIVSVFTNFCYADFYIDLPETSLNGLFLTRNTMTQISPPVIPQEINNNNILSTVIIWIMVSLIIVITSLIILEIIKVKKQKENIEIRK